MTELAQTEAASEANQSHRTMAMLCHILTFCGYLVPLGNVLGPLVLWLMKRNESPFIDAHGKEALNFQISVIIYAIISAILIFLIIGIIMLIALIIFDLVCTIIAAVKASSGQTYRYPLTIRFIR